MKFTLRPRSVGLAVGLCCLGAVVGAYASTGGHVGYDPAGPVLTGIEGRNLGHDRRAFGMALLTSAGVLLVIVAGVLWGGAALLRDLSGRVKLALALSGVALTGRLLECARYSGIRDGDEVIDFAQVALSPFTGLRPVELIFPTGWTLLSGALYAPLVWLNLDPSVEFAYASALVSSAPAGLLFTRCLSVVACALLALAIARRVLLVGGVSGGVLSAGVWTLTLPTAYLAATAGPHMLALALAWLAVLLLSADDPFTPSKAAFVGALTGWSIACHPLAALVAMWAWPFPVWRALRSGGSRSVAWMIVCAASAFLVANPWIFEQWAAYRANWEYRAQELFREEAVADVGVDGGLRWFFRHPIVTIMSAVWLMASIRVTKFRQTRYLLPVVVGLGTLVTLGGVSTQFDRYFSWGLPGIAIACGLPLSQLIRLIRRPRVDAVCTALVLFLTLAWTEVRVDRAACPKGIAHFKPWVTVAQERADGPIQAVFQLPQLARAAHAGLVSHELAHQVERVVSERLGGNASLHLSPYDLRRPLPRSVAQRAGLDEVWELRWSRNLRASAPLQILGRPSKPSKFASARCGMLLRAVVTK